MDWEVNNFCSHSVDGDVGKQAWAHSVLLASPALLPIAIPPISTTSSTNYCRDRAWGLPSLSLSHLEYTYKKKHYPGISHEEN